MNERYLFRGKRVDNGEWIEGYLVKYNERYYIYYEYADEMCQTGNYLSYKEVIPETVCQRTTLTDKNGKLIFEGDVVKADAYIFIVKFGKCGGVANDENYGYMGYYLDGFDSMTKKVLRFGLRNDICFFTDIEVIGNIHDNDLLEVER